MHPSTCVCVCVCVHMNMCVVLLASMKLKSSLVCFFALTVIEVQLFDGLSPCVLCALVEHLGPDKTLRSRDVAERALPALLQFTSDASPEPRSAHASFAHKASQIQVYLCESSCIEHPSEKHALKGAVSRYSVIFCAFFFA